jgi:hypothetical protein
MRVHLLVPFDFSCCSDIIFPTLPRWFTTAIHPEKNDEEVASKTSTADPSSMRELRTVRSTEYLHSHALVESLFNSVFIARFINLQPTSKPFHASIIPRLILTQVLSLCTLPGSSIARRRPQPGIFRCLRTIYLYLRLKMFTRVQIRTTASRALILPLK